jgi:tetrahydrodipicolinate N-succinyltransferase
LLGGSVAVGTSVSVGARVGMGVAVGLRVFVGMGVGVDINGRPLTWQASPVSPRERRMIRKRLFITALLDGMINFSVIIIS